MPRKICYFPYGFRTFSIKPSRRSILTMFSVILVDAIRTVPFLSMSAFLIEVIISAIVSLPMTNSNFCAPNYDIINMFFSLFYFHFLLFFNICVRYNLLIDLFRISYLLYNSLIY